jgi:hypothetical protein
MRVVCMLAAAAIAALGAVPAASQEAFEPNLRSERVYFECGGEKVHNVAQQQGTTPTWSTTKPAQSVSAGAGCGSVDSVFTQSAPGNLYDTTWAGAFEGNLDTVTVELHGIYVGPARATGPYDVAVRLYVDGEALTLGESGLGANVAVKPVRSATGLSEKLVFSITDIGFVAEEEDDVHDVALLIQGGTTINRGPTVTNTVNGWVWGTTEVPAGITFNPAELAETRIAATRG